MVNQKEIGAGNKCHKKSTLIKDARDKKACFITKGKCDNVNKASNCMKQNF